jgi:hypothetical protein
MPTLVVADHAPILVAEVSTLEAALHLAALLRVASGFRTAVRCPDGTIIGDRAALGRMPNGSCTVDE